MTLDDLVGRGLQREPARADELRRLRHQIAVRLADARSPHISRGSRFDIAYEALSQIGIAALRAHDLRPDSRGGHHVIALQSLSTTIGYPRDRITTAGSVQAPARSRAVRRRVRAVRGRTGSLARVC